MQNNKFTRPPQKAQYSTTLCSIEMRLSTWNKDSHGLYDY